PKSSSSAPRESIRRRWKSRRGTLPPCTRRSARRSARRKQRDTGRLVRLIARQGDDGEDGFTADTLEEARWGLVGQRYYDRARRGVSSQSTLAQRVDRRWIRASLRAAHDRRSWNRRICRCAANWVRRLRATVPCRHDLHICRNP